MRLRSVPRLTRTAGCATTRAARLNRMVRAGQLVLLPPRSVEPPDPTARSTPASDAPRLRT